MKSKISKAKLLDLLKKHNYVKQDVADAIGIDEKTIRRWCREYTIDTEFERKKAILAYTPTVIIPAGLKKAGLVPGNGKLERVFVYSDMQIPYHSKTAVSIALQRCKDYKPDHCIIIGDFMDCA